MKKFENETRKGSKMVEMRIARKVQQKQPSVHVNVPAVHPTARTPIPSESLLSAVCIPSHRGRYEPGAAEKH